MNVVSAIWSDVDRSGTVTPDIELAEQAWAGGIADFGERRAAEIVKRMPGYAAYATALRDAVRRHVGFPLTTYRAILKRTLREMRESPYSTNWGVTLDKDFARAWPNLAAHRHRGAWELATILVDEPLAIVMRGKREESELVLDTGWIGLWNDKDGQVVSEPIAPGLKNPVASGYLAVDPEMSTGTAALAGAGVGAALGGLIYLLRPKT